MNKNKLLVTSSFDYVVLGCDSNNNLKINILGVDQNSSDHTDVHTSSENSR